MKESFVLIGPAGWNYKDWRGIVYPQRLPKGFQELRYLADFINLIEINSTFYKIPTLESVKAWLDQVRGQANFKFSIKLFQHFTHADYPPAREHTDSFRRILDLVQQENRLAALLIQFPWRFKNNPENMDHIFNLAKMFKDFPTAVEFRHDSWMTKDVFKHLQENHLAFVNIDEPGHDHSLPLSSFVTADFAYLRLHGRNADMWFNEKSDAAQRYNYLYNESEMNSIISSINDIRDKTGNLYIIFNNHFRGKAIINAFQMMAKIYSQPPRLPAILVEHAPELRRIGEIKDNEQLSLF